MSYKFILTVLAFNLFLNFSVSPHPTDIEYAKQMDSPWLALIINKFENDKMKNKCGGSLVRSRYIITAAHCVSKLVDEFNAVVGAKHLEIILGDWKTDKDPDCDYSAEEEEICDTTAYLSAKKIVLHKDFEDNDIAIIKLTQYVRLTDLISNIELPEPTMCGNDFKKEEWIVNGFGLYNDTSYTKVKKKVNIKIVEMDECKKESKDEKSINNGTYICGENTKGLPTCSGDSGSSAVNYIDNKPFLQGIVSAGTRSCTVKKHPTLFIKVSCYIDWINYKIDEMENIVRKMTETSTTTATTTEASPDKDLGGMFEDSDED